MKLTRIDYIGQNGPDGAIYEEINTVGDCMSDAKWEEDTLAEMIEINQKTGQYKTDEEYYLTKLIDDHWAFVKELIIAHGNELDICIAEFHYKSAFRHGFKHALEYVGENKDDKTS